MSQPKAEKQEIVLVAALLAAVVARTWIAPMFSSLWIDEWSMYLISREGPARISEFAGLYVAEQRLISLMAWLGMQVWGGNEFGLRAYSLLSGGFCLVAIYQLGKRWFDQRTALLSVLLLPCLHAVYQQTANARAYMLALAFFLGLLWSVELWLERRRWYWLLVAALCSFLVVNAHLMQAVGVGLAGLRILWTARPWTRWPWPLAALLPGVAEALRQVIQKPLASLNYLPMPTPVDFLQALFPQPAAGLVLLVLAAVLGLRLGVLAGNKAPPMLYYVLAAWLLPPILIYSLSLGTKVSVFLPRYYFTAFPAAAWGLGWLLAQVEPFRWRAVAAVLVAAGSAMIVAGTQARPHPNHENWRAAFTAIEQRRGSPAEPVLYYSGFLEADFPEWRESYKPGGMFRAGMEFYRFDGNIIGLPYSPRPERIAELRPRLDAALAGNKRLWLLSRSQQGDMLDWVNDYLTARGWQSRRIGSYESVRVDVIEPVSKPSGQ